MSVLKKDNFLLLAALFLLLISCATQSDQYFEKSNLPGMIYDMESRPCKDVRISIYPLGVEEAIHTVTSDIHGRYTFPSLCQGHYRIGGYREGYELLEQTFFYSSPLEVLYLKIFSQNQLLSQAISLFENRDLVGAQGLIERAESIKDDHPSFLYVKALLFHQRKEYEKATIPLLKIVNLGYRLPYVHLFLAELYQYKLDQKREALINLKIYDNLVARGEMGFRIRELEENEI